MATTIRCDIVSAEAEIFSGAVEMVVATGEMGELGIAPRHAPLITRLKPGQVRVILPGGEEQFFYVSGGILEVQPQVVTVLTDTAIRAKDLDEAAAKTAKDEAEKALANRTDAMEIAEAQAKLAEAVAQLQALERLRRNLKQPATSSSDAKRRPRAGVFVSRARRAGSAIDPVAHRDEADGRQATVDQGLGQPGPLQAQPARHDNDPERAHRGQRQPGAHEAQETPPTQAGLAVLSEGDPPVEPEPQASATDAGDQVARCHRHASRRQRDEDRPVDGELDQADDDVAGALADESLHGGGRAVSGASYQRRAATASLQCGRSNGDAPNESSPARDHPGRR
jgi:F-type H+-transporting ATPase subunit epsilon